MTGILYACSTCRRRIAHGDTVRCLECGTLYPAIIDNSPHQPESGDINSQDSDSDSQNSGSTVSKLFDAEDVAVERLVTGHEAIDLVTGGGYARGNSYAIHGPGGIGKSRIALASIALACRIGPTVYALATAEERKEDVRRHAKDAGYFDGDLGECVRDNLTCFDQEDDPIAIADKIRAVDPVFVVVDASSALDDQKFASQLLREMAKQSNAVILSVFHETVEGKMAGGSKLTYLVDVILDMDGVKPNKKGKGWKKLPSEEPSPYSRLRSRKNRHGAQAVYAILELTAHGFDVVELCDGKEKAAP